MENQEQADRQPEDKTTASSGGGNVNVSGDISGSGIVIGHHITTGDIIVEIDQSIQHNPNNEYLKGLKALTQELSKEYEKYNVPEEKRTEINKNIQILQKEVKDLKPETKVEDIPEPKQKEIKTKTRTLIEKIVDALPAASESIANLTPLSPFSKLIGGGVQSMVDAYTKYKESQS